MWASPGAARSEVAGVADGRLRVRLAAPAHGGRANAELVRVLAARLGVRRADVTVVRGATTRRKIVAVRGIRLATARAKLGLEEG